MPLADETALGLLETHGLVAGIEAADAMLKTAEVRLVALERTIPALITIKIVGETAAVQASVDAGRAAAERVGRVVSAHVIPRPADEVRAMMRLDDRPQPGRSGLFSESRTHAEPTTGRLESRERKKSRGRTASEPTEASAAASSASTPAPSGTPTPAAEPEPSGKSPSAPEKGGAPPAAISRGTSGDTDTNTDADELEKMTVPELRAMARELPDFPIQGRDVARARKSQLIAALRRYRSG